MQNLIKVRLFLVISSVNYAELLAFSLQPLERKYTCALMANS